MWVKRDDLIHPIVSGNKWRKLATTAFEDHEQIVSIGGAYSNHLHALGYKCKAAGKPFVALVRGNYQHNLTPMLKDLHAWGCQVHYLTKAEYKQRDEAAFSRWVQDAFGPSLFIPEGGSTESALEGVGEILDEVYLQMHQFGCKPIIFIAPVASGATLAGIINRAENEQQVLGIAVLKGQDYLTHQVSRFLSAPKDNWSINHDFVGKGYAKSSPELNEFIHYMHANSNIEVEPVYSGKAFFALHQLIHQQAFSANDKIVIVHTGGLQGARIN